MFLKEVRKVIISDKYFGFFFIFLSYEGSSLSYTRHSMLDYIQIYMIRLYIWFWNNSLDWILMTIMSAYLFISYISVVGIYYWDTDEIQC